MLFIFVLFFVFCNFFIYLSGTSENYLNTLENSLKASPRNEQDLLASISLCEEFSRDKIDLALLVDVSGCIISS